MDTATSLILPEVVRKDAKGSITNNRNHNPTLIVESVCQNSAPFKEGLTSQNEISIEQKSLEGDSNCTSASDGTTSIESLHAPPDFAAARQSLVRYKCDICGRVCPSKHKLKRHLSTHSKERPFPCSICGRSFKWTEYLQKHMRQQHSMPSKETHAFEGEKSLSPSSKLKGIKSHFSVQAKEIFEVSDISDSTDAQGKELEVQKSHDSLGDGETDVSKVLNSDSLDEVDCGPTKHSVSIGVDMDAEDDQDSDDSLPLLLETGDMDLITSSEVSPHLYDATKTDKSTDFFHEPQVPYIPLSEYSSLPISCRSSVSTCFQPTIQFHQSSTAHTQYSVSPYEAACSLLNSNSLMANSQSNASSNHPVSNGSLDYCLGSNYEPSLITNTKMSDLCDPSQNTNVNFIPNTSYFSPNNKCQGNFNVFRMDNTISPVDTMNTNVQVCTFDSALQALTNSSQLHAPVNSLLYDTMETSYPIVYPNGQSQYGVNSYFQVNNELSTSCCIQSKSHCNTNTTNLLHQSVPESSNSQLDICDTTIDSDFNTAIVEQSADSVSSTCIDIGIQCELGPETLQAMADEEGDDEYDDEELREIQSDELEAKNSVELKAPASDTIRSLLTEDRHVQKYPCRVSNCNKAYIHKKDVIRHMKIRHGITPQNLEAVLVETPEKPHICGVGHCRRSYFHLKDLKRHRRLCHDVSPCTSKLEKPPVLEEDVTEPDEIGSTKYLMRFPCDFPGCLRSYVHKKDLVRHKRLYHNDATSKPSIPVPIKYTENELKHIRQRVKQEIDTKVEKIRLDSTGSNTSTSTGSDEESLICVSSDDLTSETKCTILLSSSSSLQNIKPGIDLSTTITGDLASLLGAIEQHGPIFRNC